MKTAVSTTATIWGNIAGSFVGPDSCQIGDNLKRLADFLRSCPPALQQNSPFVLFESPTRQGRDNFPLQSATTHPISP